jgi:hypothetical protein
MSQRHKRDIHGYDASGDTPYTLDDKNIPPGALTKDAAGQTVAFATYFPTGTAFALSVVPTGMSIDADTGVLSGTPTALQANVASILTVTYTSPNGPRTHTVDWRFTVAA